MSIGFGMSAHDDDGSDLPRLDDAAPPSNIVDEDLRKIIQAALDLAYYRTLKPEAAELQRAVAYELQDRVSKLPEVKAL